MATKQTKVETPAPEGPMPADETMAAALADFEQEMENVVIPAIDEAVNERLRAANEMREWFLKL